MIKAQEEYEKEWKAFNEKNLKREWMIVRDNSVYGLSIDTSEIDLYESPFDSRQNIPISSGKPVENWFWSIRSNGQPWKLVDSYNGLIYGVSGAVTTIH